MQKFERPGRETRPTSSPTQSACSCSSARAEANFGVKTTAPSRLYWAERPAMRVVQALHWLHDAGGDTDPAVAKRLRSIFADPDHGAAIVDDLAARSEEHTSELQPLMRISYAVFCLKKKNN